jgi:hypothetical protein
MRFTQPSVIADRTRMRAHVLAGLAKFWARPSALLQLLCASAHLAVRLSAYSTTHHDADNGGLSINPNFFVDFGAEPDGPVLAHEVGYRCVLHILKRAPHALVASVLGGNAL